MGTAAAVAGAHPKLVEWRNRAGRPRGGAAFVVARGELIDGWCFDGPRSAAPGLGQVGLFRSLVARAPVPFCPGLGNHDIEWARNFEVFREGSCDSPRRQVGRTGYGFLVFDRGEKE